MNKNVKIGCQLFAMYGDLPRMQAKWMEAEALGADRLYTTDHLFAVALSTSVLEGDQSKTGTVSAGQVYEGTTVQAAMAVTTKRAEIGCMVHANSYRNANMMAYIANTIDHLSGGRYILGMGTGHVKTEYDAFGYEHGTQTSRAQALARDIGVIKSRLQQVIPPPTRRIPLMIASMGEKIGMKIVAEHADIWQAYGPLDTIRQKYEVLLKFCKEVGRDPKEIVISTYFAPELLKDADLDKILELGAGEIICMTQGPDWDLGRLKEMLAWRKALS